MTDKILQVHRVHINNHDCTGHMYTPPGSPSTHNQDCTVHVYSVWLSTRFFCPGGTDSDTQNPPGTAEKKKLFTTQAIKIRPEVGTVNLKGTVTCGPLYVKALTRQGFQISCGINISLFLFTLIAITR